MMYFIIKMETNTTKHTVVLTENTPIVEDEEFLLLRKVYTPETVGISTGQLNLGYTMLKYALMLMYKSTKVSKLINERHTNQSCSRFSHILNDVLEINMWKRTTGLCAFSAMKRILALTNIDTTFLSRILIPLKKPDTKTIEACIPKAHRDNSVIIDLVKTCKNKSKYKCNSSLKTWISFILCLLETLEIAPEDYALLKDAQYDRLVEAVKATRPKHPMLRKIVYTSTLLCNILGMPPMFEALKKQLVTENPIIMMDGDAHRFSNTEIDMMYTEAKKNLRDETLLVLMLTTGMRAIGTSNLKIANISNTINDKLVIKQSGTTLEKGNKWFTFPMNKMIQNLLHKWITTQRKSNGEYVFPGMGENTGLSTHRINTIIKEIAQRCGIEGKHVHAHSLRHSYAHMLLESGNTPESVSKMMGHASSTTTEKYYLKETAVEASKRMNVPWLSAASTVQVLPKFMQHDGEKKPNKKEKKMLLMKKFHEQL